jgi:hypothetical protein
MRMFFLPAIGRRSRAPRQRRPGRAQRALVSPAPSPARGRRGGIFRLLWPERQATFVMLVCLSALLVRLAYVLTLEPHIYW